MAHSRGVRQRTCATAAGTSAGQGAAAAWQLPASAWQNVMRQLADTDLLRSADVAARDIAAAACTCRTASQHAGAGWRALRPASADRTAPPETESEDETDRCYKEAQEIHARGEPVGFSGPH